MRRVRGRVWSACNERPREDSGGPRNGIATDGMAIEDIGVPGAVVFLESLVLGPAAR